jgi:opacity protein-like surface antigen
VVDEKQAAGRAPRTFAGEGEDQVDVGGSYRLTRNLNVTAGVRYSQQDRERLHPLTDGKQDNQAVYVGTQFRF